MSTLHTDWGSIRWTAFSRVISFSDLVSRLSSVGDTFKTQAPHLQWPPQNAVDYFNVRTIQWMVMSWFCIAFNRVVPSSLDTSYSSVVNSSSMSFTLKATIIQIHAKWKTGKTSLEYRLRNKSLHLNKTDYAKWKAALWLTSKQIKSKLKKQK